MMCSLLSRHTRPDFPVLPHIRSEFLSQDSTGHYETVFFPKAYNRFCHMLNEMRPYLIRGKVEEDFTAVTLAVHWVEFLDRRHQ
jgi:DNA polymerase III alpha subunit